MSVRFDQSAPYEVEETRRPVREGGRHRSSSRASIARRARRPRRSAAIVDVHGGAWTRLDRTAGRAPRPGLAAAGARRRLARLPPGARAQASGRWRQDAAAGVRWVRAHAQRLGVDPARIGAPRAIERRAHRAARGGSAGRVRRHAHRHAGRLARDRRRRCGRVRRSRAYPVADPLARHRFMAAHKDDPKFPNAPRLVESSLGYFGSEAAMSEAQRDPRRPVRPGPGAAARVDRAARARRQRAGRDPRCARDARGRRRAATSSACISPAPSTASSARRARTRRRRSPACGSSSAGIS